MYKYKYICININKLIFLNKENIIQKRGRIRDCQRNPEKENTKKEK